VGIGDWIATTEWDNYDGDGVYVTRVSPSAKSNKQNGDVYNNHTIKQLVRCL
jgi:hypothetical protein